MHGRAQGGKQGGNDALFDSLKPVVKLVQNAYRRARPDDWNYALLMKCNAERSMCADAITAIHALIRSPLFENSLTVMTSTEDIRMFQQRIQNCTPVETQAFCMLCARALFEHHRFFDALEFAYQALKLVLVDSACVFPRWTRPVFDAIAGNFKTLWALCKVTQVSAFAENVDTMREGAPDQLVEINMEVFRLTSDDIMKKCRSCLDNREGEQDVELDTLWPIIPMYIIWIEHFFNFKDFSKISANLPKLGKEHHRFKSDLGFNHRNRDPGGEIEPFHMFPFEKEKNGKSRTDDDAMFQWFDMARLNYLMARFKVLMQNPICETPFSVALDAFPKADQPQYCLQGFYGNYGLFGAAPARLCLSLLRAFFSPMQPPAGVILNYVEPAWQVLPSDRYPKANKLLAIFLAFCRLAYPEVADRLRSPGALKPRLATHAFCRKFCPGLAPFMKCFREGNVTEFRQLQQRHAESLWRLGLTILVASLETLVIRRLVICYVAVYREQFHSVGIRSVKEMLRSRVFQARWKDSEDAQIQAVIMLFSSKLLKANMNALDDDPSDFRLVFPPDRVWPDVAAAKGKKK